MHTTQVEVYRLWPNGTWDKATVEVLSEPWTMEIVESRAASAAWQQLIGEKAGPTPFQIGLYMPSFKDKDLNNGQ